MVGEAQPEAGAGNGDTPGVGGDSRVQSDVLEDLAAAVHYRRWLVELALPWLGERNLEVGSGLGDYAAEIAKYGKRVIATEADAGRLAYLRRRFDAHPTVQVRELLAPIDEDGDHDSVVAFNVLEHIEDDVAALASFSRLVRPGGHVVIFVPAFPFAMSRFDRQIGHVRRYRHATLTQAFNDAGLQLVTIRHVNSIGLIAWFVGMRLLRLSPRDGLLLRAYDRLVVPLLRRLEARLPPPFGQSLFAVGKPPRG